MQTKVVKFGGSSIADAGQFKKVAEIVKSDPARRFVVASAPGKRDKNDTKVTDLLYKLYDAAAAGADCEGVLEQIERRFADIIADLGLAFDLGAELTRIRAEIARAPQRDYLASRGEYLNSKILAAYLGFDFVDAAEVVRFRADGSFDADVTDTLLSAALETKSFAVVPGFYGTLPDGTVKTFSRGGSDVTGSLVARAARAQLYENWTDVSGMLAADPRVVDDPRVIEFVTYEELRELSYMGASVLHEDAVFPARRAGIPINIRNTNRPADAGTLISSRLPENVTVAPVTGIAGRKGMTSVHVEKSMMNTEVGFGAALLTIFSKHGVPFEHCPTGIDSISVLVPTEQFGANAEAILAEIRERLRPDSLSVETGLALIAVVGHGVNETGHVAAKVFTALAEQSVGVRMIDQGSGLLNIILGVAEADYERASRAIYRACAQ